MADSQWNSHLVTQALNFHGHQFMKQLTASNFSEVKKLDLENVDYKVNQARQPEIK